MASCLLKALELYLLNMRDKFDDFFLKAENLMEARENLSDKRNRNRSVRLTRFDGSSEEAHFNPKEKLKITIFYPIIDSLCFNLKMRQSAYEKLNDNFKFLTALHEMNTQQIEEACKYLANTYDQDISAENLVAEYLHFKHYLYETSKDEALLIQDLYLKIKKDCMSSTFPNLEIACRIFLSLMLSNCSGDALFLGLNY